MVRQLTVHMSTLGRCTNTSTTPPYQHSLVSISEASVRSSPLW